MYKTTLHENVRHSGVGRFLIYGLPLLLSLFTACRSHEEQLVRLYGEAQGTYYSVQYRDSQQRNLQPQIDSLLQAFDQSASLWVDSSLLRRINDRQTDSLDALLDSLLNYSLAIERYTDGAFNCRVGRLVQVWGFSFRQRSEPDSTALQALLAAAHAPLQSDQGRIQFTDPRTELDFNAIAQGYASDLVAQLLAHYGIRHYLIDIGGEVVARGNKGFRSPWRVGIERPSADSLSAPVVQTVLPLSDAAVVTSGSYRKYYERDGVRYSHTIQPATGRPVEHSLLSATVVERSAWLADAMATAYMVMGLDSALSFIAAHPQGPGTETVYFIYDQGGQLATYATPAFEQMTLQQ